YLMIKNHPFQNGNKRVAVITLYYFLHMNNRRLKVGNRRLYEFAKEVAASEATDRERVVADIRSFIVEFSEKEKVD
ncbi:type II toxin-antitoxin system death-on-curing family toxin, partial [Candidatus Kaiserbacteria bacterium]|nr:type II toxin-antitoxin system death-on-curing family toxin [Candidatus Kaiserbacteria bacterium]